MKLMLFYEARRDPIVIENIDGVVPTDEWLHLKRAGKECGRYRTQGLTYMCSGDDSIIEAKI